MNTLNKELDRLNKLLSNAERIEENLNQKLKNQRIKINEYRAKIKKLEADVNDKRRIDNCNKLEHLLGHNLTDEEISRIAGVLKKTDEDKEIYETDEM